MSSLAVGQRPFVDNASQAPLVETENSNDFWTQRSVEDDSESFLTPEAKVIALRILGGLALASAGVALGVAAFSIMAPSVALVAIPAALLAGYLFWHSTQINDYDDSAMIGHLREKAQRMTLDEVVAQHGWKKIFEDQILSPNQFAMHYRKQVKDKSVKDCLAYHQKVAQHIASYNETRSGGCFYSIPEPQEHVSKWRRETSGNAQTRKTFQQIVEEYPIDQLENLGMIERREMKKIRELLVIYQTAQRVLKGHEDSAQAEYELAVAPFSQALNQTTAALEAQFAANPSICELERLRDAEAESQRNISNRFASQLREAKGLHQRNVSALSPNGRPVARDNLSPANRAIYDRSAAELFTAEQRIRQESTRQLEENKAQFAERKTILTAEKERLSERLNREKEAAQQQFDVKQRPAAAVKERAIQPDREQLKRIADNLDQQYRAYLRQLAAS